MTWNYRIIRKYFEKTDTISFQIHEVYYDDKDQIEGWTQSSVGPSGETILELREDIEHFMETMQKPILQEKYDEGREILVEVHEPK
ncbi:MAG: hypothetical protein U9Q77_00980 [Candidatus Marinimicrobia bacterium]|nr:hypothetical protein [Candidatus Neomarinimicrobiota bacterium]